MMDSEYPEADRRSLIAIANYIRQGLKDKAIETIF